MIIFVCSHRRSGTHWTLDTIRHNFPAVSKRFVQDGQLQRGEVTPAEVRAEGQPLLVKGHILPDEGWLYAELSPELAAFFLEEIPRSKVVYVYRDGRDVMVSQYYYLQKIDRLGEDPSFSAFLRRYPMRHTPYNRVGYWAHHVRTWLRQPHIHTVTYEALHNDFGGVVAGLAGYLGLESRSSPVSVDLRQGSTYQGPGAPLVNRLRELVQPSARSSAVAPRKGITGDWRSHFSQEDLVYFMEHAGPLLLKLGYPAE